MNTNYIISRVLREVIRLAERWITRRWAAKSAAPPPQKPAPDNGEHQAK